MDSGDTRDPSSQGDCKDQNHPPSRHAQGHVLRLLSSTAPPSLGVQGSGVRHVSMQTLGDRLAALAPAPRQVTRVPQGPGPQAYEVLTSRTFQGLRGHVPGAGRGPVLSLERARCEHPRPAELRIERPAGLGECSVLSAQAVPRALTQSVQGSCQRAASCHKQSQAPEERVSLLQGV